MVVITNSYYQLHCPYETFSFSEILVCVGRTTSSYMGTGPDHLMLRWEMTFPSSSLALVILSVPHMCTPQH